MVQSHVRLFPDFLLFNEFMFVVHANVLSRYNININSWNHQPFGIHLKHLYIDSCMLTVHYTTSKGIDEVRFLS